MPADAQSDAVLRLEGLQAWYGESHILHGIDLLVRQGEVVTLLGRNGAGRTTIFKSILGLVGRRRGSVQLRGEETIALPPHRIARFGGLGYCPEERGIFASLDVDENLRLPPRIAPGGLSVAELYEMFPNLAERRRSQGSKLSGGEQQMLAIARILRTGATLLLLDEITEGLAPVIVDQLDEVIRQLRERGYTIVMVEQNFAFAQKLAERHYIIEQGAVAEHFAADELAENDTRLERYLSV